MFLKITLKSLLSRRGTVLMTVLTLAISLSLLFSIEHIRQQAKASFTSSVSGTDLIVGARSGQLNLLLYSIFRVGNPTNNISWDTYQHIKQHRQIEWTVPISLGDSHQGYRVIGTNGDYFRHFKYARQQPLSFSAGEPFGQLYDVVLGAEVARDLGYTLGDEIVISHGTGSTSFMHHDDKPFTVVGILQTTGTPVDKSLHVSLEAIEAIHLDWQHGAPMPGQSVSAEEAMQKDLTPEAITAFLVGMKSRVASFTVQRQINDYRNEPLTAILPGVALAELWQMLSSVENLLRIISALVLFAAFAGLVTTLLASMKEREREIAILRATGARPVTIFLLIQAEVIGITLAALVSALAFVQGILYFGQSYLAERFGIMISAQLLNRTTVDISLLILISAIVIACVPAITAYRKALNKGLAPRI
ncbi:peptide ABC transporter permease [Aliidiomarina minuta]|uniref:Peptide ABC transporter permease n=1 Tax=Aliidiomarina minuta TaxID=880057 RepID=A0A432W9S8_9GAMM|nr:ABC transporter permease [Aliidiomarina minuta]RUO26910.1 peptide ABC transporter permease [Aliidiomarina minuta]